jgi:hypothetical protein
MTEKWYQSKTVWAGAGQILAGVSGYCSGQMDPTGAAALVLSGVYQIIQRVMALKKAGQATPGPFPGVDAGGPGAAGA